MSLDLLRLGTADVASTRPEHASTDPGRRSVAGGLNDHEPQALFAGNADWEDVLGDHAEAQAEADLDQAPETDHAHEEEHAPQAEATATAEATHATDGAKQEATHTTSGRTRASRKKAERTKSYHVEYDYSDDGPYQGHANYDVKITGGKVAIGVGIKLNPQAGVSKKQVRSVKDVSQKNFMKYYNNRFKLVTKGQAPQPMGVKLSWGKGSPVALHKGAGRDDAANWYVRSEPIVRAHEIGHLLGLTDEYADVKAPERNVKTDHSLMGNFYAEGISKARLKRRHGNHIARDVSKASGRKFRLA